jgi:hypothetical protein
MTFIFSQTASARVSSGRAFADLNAMRAAAGVPPVRRFRRSLNHGCRMHNRYMLATGQFGHSEDPGSRYYSRSGARAARASVIAQPTSLPSSAWGDTVYHRLALLQPRLRSSGYAGDYGFSCLQVLSGVSNRGAARSSAVSLYPWPGNGATGLDPTFDANELPDPLADAPGASKLGTPITVNVNGPWKNWLLVRSNVTSASMTSDAGVPVAVSASDMSSANAGYLQGGFALLPRQNLADNTGYSFTASGYVNYRGRSWPFNITSHFQTGIDPISDWF